MLLYLKPNGQQDGRIKGKFLPLPESNGTIEESGENCRASFTFRGRMTLARGLVAGCVVDLGDGSGGFGNAPLFNPFFCADGLYGLFATTWKFGG